MVKHWFYPQDLRSSGDYITVTQTHTHKVKFPRKEKEGFITWINL